MPKPHPSRYLPLFERALEEEIGIAIPFTGCTREYLRNELYAAREHARKDGETRYEEIIIFLPNNGEIWMCKKSVSHDD